MMELFICSEDGQPRKNLNEYGRNSEPGMLWNPG